MSVPLSERCKFDRYLKDGTGAQCMRRKVVGDYCQQHHKIINSNNQHTNFQGDINKPPKKPKLKAIPAKIGTQPWLIYVDRRCHIQVGNTIRIRKANHGTKWQRVRIVKINPDGYFFAEKM